MNDGMRIDVTVNGTTWNLPVPDMPKDARFVRLKCVIDSKNGTRNVSWERDVAAEQLQQQRDINDAIATLSKRVNELEASRKAARPKPTHFVEPDGTTTEFERTTLGGYAATSNSAVEQIWQGTRKGLRFMGEDYFVDGPLPTLKNPDSGPITEEWLLSVGFEKLSNGLHIKNASLMMTLNDLGQLFVTIGGIMKNISTRRDVRILCELLRIQLKETK